MNRKLKMNELRTRDFISVFFRTFFIQAVWNFKSLISVGMSFALVPVARRLCTGGQDCRKFLKRHLYFFNSHPYFASYALGAIARLEEDRFKGLVKDEEQIERFKNALIGPLGAIGDQYFWATIKPGAILAGMTGVALFGELRWQLLSILLAFILYNTPHLFVRAYGLWKGYHEGYAITRNLKIERFMRVKNLYLILGALMLGIFAVSRGLTYFEQGLPELFVFILSLLTATILQMRKKNMYLTLGLPLVLALIIGML